MTSDETTTKALRIIERELEAIGFDLDRNARATITSIEERNELLERRKSLVRLYRMHGGDPEAIKLEPMAAAR